MRALFRWLYSLYVGSFLHPHLGTGIKHLLRMRNRLIARAPFVHDLGAFRMNLDLDQLIDNSIFHMGTWEAKSIAAIDRLLPAGGVAVDVGANIGFMSLHMGARVGRSGRVFAFEPNTWAVDRLRANLALNDLPQVHVERAGLSNAPGREDDVLVHYGYPLVGERPTMRDSIVTMRLDDFFDAHPVDRLDFLKCDTDGWEVHVLEGARRTLSRFRPALLLEVNPRGLAERGHDVAKLVACLRELGYAIHDEETLAPFVDLEGAAARVAATGHDFDVVALPVARASEQAGGATLARAAGLARA